jgi:hypothetical protein
MFGGSVRFLAGWVGSIAVRWSPASTQPAKFGIVVTCYWSPDAGCWVLVTGYWTLEKGTARAAQARVRRVSLFFFL